MANFNLFEFVSRICPNVTLGEHNAAQPECVSERIRIGHLTLDTGSAHTHIIHQILRLHQPIYIYIFATN